MFSSVTSKVLRLATTARTTPGSFACFSTQTGTVKWFDTRKGFGFIVPDSGDEDIFVHQTAIHAEGFRSLGEGEAVEYSVMTDPGGRVKAERVTGPNGGFVQGAPRRTFDGGFGGGFGQGGGFGGQGGGFGGQGGGFGNYGGGGGFGGGFGGGGGFGSSETPSTETDTGFGSDGPPMDELDTPSAGTGATSTDSTEAKPDEKTV